MNNHQEVKIISHEETYEEEDGFRAYDFMLVYKSFYLTGKYYLDHPLDDIVLKNLPVQYEKMHGLNKKYEVEFEYLATGESKRLKSIFNIQLIKENPFLGGA